MKQLNVVKGVESTSKGKGKGSTRSAMLRVVMSKLSGETGEKIGQAVADEDGDKFFALWVKAGKEIKEKFNK